MSKSSSAGSPQSTVYIISGLISAVVAAVMCVAGFFAYDAVRGGDSEGGAPAAQASPVPTASAAQPSPTATGPIEVSVDDDPFLGPEDAPITIVSFADFQ